MSTYELDDDLVRQTVSCWRDEHEDLSAIQIHKLMTALQEQVPIPVPDKVGAVVRTELGTFVRADGSTIPWISVRMPGVSFVDRPDWLPDDQIGRITEVLSPGADL